MSTAARISVEGTGRHFVQDADDTVLRAALRGGVGIPYECNSGGCGSCRIQVVDGDVVDLWPDAPGRSERDRRKGLVLACQTRASSDATIRVRTSDEYCGTVAPVRQPARVITIGAVTHDMRRLVVRTEGLPGSNRASTCRCSCPASPRRGATRWRTSPTTTATGS
ncbi:MAG: 2Fe-2S iron-sulfur cluster-binding protein [Ilumatobacteraceae bacterium]